MLARTLLMRGAAAAASGLTARASEAARSAALVPRPLPHVSSRFAAAGHRSQPSSLVVRAYSDSPVAAEATQEIDWSPSVANSVRVAGPVAGKDVRAFERGKKLSFVVGVKPDRKNRPNDIDWYSVEAWGPLAERAEHLIERGNQVAVEGRLRTDKWQDKETGAPRSAVKILASSIQKVRSTGNPGGDGAYAGGYASSGQEAPWDVQPQAEAAAGWDPQPGQQQSAPASGKSDVETHWMDLFSHPDQWYDNRLTKTNPKGPDFKKKGGRDAPALWITSRDTPGWVHDQLPDLKSQQ